MGIAFVKRLPMAAWLPLCAALWLGVSAAPALAQASDQHRQPAGQDRQDYRGSQRERHRDQEAGAQRYTASPYPRDLGQDARAMRAQRRREALDRYDQRRETGDELMEALQFRSNSLVLANVRRNTWAFDAGLRPGDRIVRIDDRRPQSAGDLGRLLDETSGGLMRIRVIRDGQEEVLTASLSDEYLGPDRRLPYDRQYSDEDLFDSIAASSPGRPTLREPPRRLERPWLGVTMRTDRGGVRVTSVAGGSPADEAGLRRQDRIAAINGEPIYRSEDVTWMVANSPPGATLEIEVTRNGRDRFLVASLDGRAETARRPGDNLTR